MVSKGAIDAGLSSHAQWKSRLLDAISRGTSDFEVNAVRRDDECQFGKWFHSLPTETQETDVWREIHALHASFHETAAEILRLAVQGDRAGALKKLAYGETYGRISGKLVLALNKWKERL
jgi:Chemoreceptor zinc-binding domain